MSQEKNAVEQENADRMMSLAMGISRRCKEAGVSYSELAKAANVKDDELAPAVAQVLADASEKLAKKEAE